MTVAAAEQRLRFYIPIIFMVGLFSVLLIYLETVSYYLPTPFFPFSSERFGIFFILFIWICLVVIFTIFGSPFKEFRKQKIHDQASWFKFYYFSLVLTPLVSLIIFKAKLFPDFLGLGDVYRLRDPLEDLCLVQNRLLDSCLPQLKASLPDKVLGLSPGDAIQFISRVSLFIIGMFLYRFAPGLKQDTRYWRFAPDTINKNNDLFDWQARAEDISQELLASQNHVSVYLVEAPLGEGKSSFSRMIIESFSDLKQEILYTYLSLTETNEVHDFSKLFAERWYTTLKERYPKIDTFGSSALLTTIFRETGNGLLAGLLEFISNRNIALNLTRAKIFDRNFHHDPASGKIKYVTPQVAALFGNVEEIVEPVWVVLVDEIDRAPVDEVYRTIEIMERFKYEGRVGLPVRIVFLLCVDRSTLLKNMDIMQSSSRKACLVGDFYKSKKNFDGIYSLPLTGPSQKLNFITQKIISAFQLSGQFEEEDLKILSEDLNKVAFANDLYRPEIDHIKNEERISYVVTLLTGEHLRVIIRVIDDFANQLRITKREIFWADLLALSYIKLTYPQLINFFRETIDTFIDKKHEVNNWWLKDGREKNSKTDIIDWVESVLGQELDEQHKKVFRKLIGLAAHCYIDQFTNGKVPRADYAKEKSSSLPENLRAYLLQEKTAKGEFIENHNLYLELQSGKKDFKDLPNLKLYHLSQFFRNTESLAVDSKMYLNLAEEILTRFNSKKITPDLRHVSSFDDITLYHQLTYEFCYCLLWAVELGKKVSGSYSQAIDLLVKFLESAVITTGSKFITVNAFVNSERGSGDIGYRFERVWNEIFTINNPGLLKNVQKVFDEAKKRYFNSTGDSLYQKEENFFYVMYQYWSGDANNLEEIKAVQRAALRKISSYPEIIELYWNKLYPDVKEFDGDKDFFMTSYGNQLASLYMPIENLIEITIKSKKSKPEIIKKAKDWKANLDKVKTDGIYQSLYKLVDKSDTLRNFLLRKNIISG